MCFPNSATCTFVQVCEGFASEADPRFIGGDASVHRKRSVSVCLLIMTAWSSEDTKHCIGKLLLTRGSMSLRQDEGMLSAS